MNPAVFREYDIRGIAERDFDADFARRLGGAFATMAAEQGATLLGVGRDCRLTSDGYALALQEGIAGAGVDVSDLGVCPTPLVYFAIWHWGFGGGVQVTGSHNPSDHNGFKLCVGPHALHGEQIQALRRLIESGPSRRGTGRIRPREVVSVYQDHVAATLGTLGRQISVVVDAGNGTAGAVAPALYERLGARVT
ncbi:MAG TPA: phosphomannomutase, partial [Candidatus Binatia bacterium]|nr:phosphomannomutase [Candidatus Binatia bacterium]